MNLSFHKYIDELYRKEKEGIIITLFYIFDKRSVEKIQIID